MELSLFLAQAWGIYLMVMSLALLINKQNVKLIFAAYRHSSTVFFSGAIELLIGILTVLTHNVWTTDYRLLITLFGWTALLRGIIRLFQPDLTTKFVKNFEKNAPIQWLLFVALALGGYLAAVGFGILY